MKVTTIERHFLDHASHQTDISNILYDINVAAKLIRQKVIRAGLNADLMGTSGTTNNSGEDVQALDIYSNNVVKEILSGHQRFSFMGSEEETDVVQTNSHDKSDFVILFDPLDGSSNIDVNVSVGTIFSIYKKKKAISNPLDQCLQKGIEHFSLQQTYIGAQLSKASIQEEALQRRQIVMSEELSKLEDADITKLVTELQTMLVNRDAATQAFAKIGQQSLFDFLR